MTQASRHAGEQKSSRVLLLATTTGYQTRMFADTAARLGIEMPICATVDAILHGGAAVDVYSTEPPPSDNPLLTLKGEGASRILLTPHIAGVTRQASAFLFRSAWQNVKRVLIDGQPPQNRVY